MIILYLILITIGAILYRMGGSDKWDTKWRDIGVPVASLLSMYILGIWHWSLWICAPLMFGAMTTYWKILNKWFGKPESDCYWFNYFAHGLMIGLSYIPYGIYTGTLPMVIIRAIGMACLISVWSMYMDDVDLEEGGRSTIIIGTLWML